MKSKKIADLDKSNNITNMYTQIMVILIGLVGLDFLLYYYILTINLHIATPNAII